MKVKLSPAEHRALIDDSYDRGFNDAVDMLQAQRYRKKRVGELWRVGLLLTYLSDKGRKLNERTQTTKPRNEIRMAQRATPHKRAIKVQFVD